jgi:DNA-binding response OmpR family regulator
VNLLNQKSVNVLVVGKDAALMELYHEILSDEGFSIILRADLGSDADEVARLAPDLIILDAVLAPNHSGWLMVQQLKTCPATAPTPVIICTTAPNEAEHWRAYSEAKGVSIVLKPFEIDHLLATVQKALGDHSGILPFRTQAQSSTLALST